MFRSLIFALLAAWPACWAWNAWAAPPRLGYWPAFVILATFGTMVWFASGRRETRVETRVFVVKQPDRSETAERGR